MRLEDATFVLANLSIVYGACCCTPDRRRVYVSENGTTEAIPRAGQDRLSLLLGDPGTHRDIDVAIACVLLYGAADVFERWLSFLGWSQRVKCVAFVLANVVFVYGALLVVMLAMDFRPLNS